MWTPHAGEDVARTRAKLDEDQLIEKYVDLDTDRYPGGRAEARLRDYGTSVWALVNHLKVVDGDVEELAQHYDLPRPAVDAALAYYRRHKDLIDARIRLNAAR